jgi:hypothetical protein
MKVDPDLKSLLKAIHKVAKPLPKIIEDRARRSAAAIECGAVGPDQAIGGEGQDVLGPERDVRNSRSG